MKTAFDFSNPDTFGCSGQFFDIQTGMNSKNTENMTKSRPPSFGFGHPKAVQNQVFWQPKKSIKNESSNSMRFYRNFSIFGRPGFDFRPFWVPKVCPGGWFFDDFPKTVILSKSSSHCGGSTILKGHTFQKSTQKATPNTKKTRTIGK